MRKNNLSAVLPRVRLWLVPAVVLVAIAVTGLAVQNADAGDKDEKRVVIERSGEHKAFLGVLMQELTDEILKGLDTTVKRGVLITEVIEGSPADKAGIEEGDIVVKFNGKKVTSPDQLRDLVAEQEIGDEIDVEVVRGKDSEKVEVTLGDWADQDTFTWIGPDDFDFSFVEPYLEHGKRYMSAMLRPRLLGVRVSEIDNELGSYFGVEEGQGVLVLGVNEESMAKTMGIKSGDVIVEVQGEEIGSARDIRESLSEVEKGDEVVVRVVRKKKTVELKGEMTETGSARWFHRGGGKQGHITIPEIHIERDDLRKELDELRKELDELKKELNKS